MKRELLDNGKIWRKKDGRWIGMIRYKDEFGITKRKSFSGKIRKDVQSKITKYVTEFQEQLADSDVSRKPLRESLKNWLQVYKYPEVEHTTYDRYECTSEHQIYSYIGDKPVGDITSADIQKMLTAHMNKGYAFTTSKKAYSILKMFFKHLYQEGKISSNPIETVSMIKKANYLAGQDKEDKAQCDLVVVFTDEELEKIKAEAFKVFANSKPMYQQSAAYFLMPKATPHKDRLAAQYHICLHIFRHIARKLLEIRQYSCVVFAQSDEKSVGAPVALPLCGVALTQGCEQVSCAESSTATLILKIE